MSSTQQLVNCIMAQSGLISLLLAHVTFAGSSSRNNCVCPDQERDFANRATDKFILVNNHNAKGLVVDPLSGDVFLEDTQEMFRGNQHLVALFTLCDPKGDTYAICQASSHASFKKTLHFDSCSNSFFVKSHNLPGKPHHHQMRAHIIGHNFLIKKDGLGYLSVDHGTYNLKLVEVSETSSHIHGVKSLFPHLFFERIFKQGHY